MGVFNKERHINAFEVDALDPTFLKPEEHTFLFFGSNLSIVRMLSGKRENYTQGTIEFREVSLKPSDLLGQKCSHSKKVVETVHTAAIGIHQNHVKYLFDESEFPAWFAKQDKDKLKPYRFVRPRRRILQVDGGSFRLRINQGEPCEEYEFEGLIEIPFASVAAMAKAPVPQASSDLGSLVAPSASPAASPAGSQGMSMYGAPSSPEPGAGRGMTMVSGSPTGGGGLAGLAAPGAGLGPKAQSTMVLCPHCSQPVRLRFETGKLDDP